MTNEQNPQANPTLKDSLRAQFLKWAVLFPALAAFMAATTEKKFFGNQMWEILRSTGN